LAYPFHDELKVACDSYYFAASFLDTIGYFDRRKRFWTDCEFPEAEALRQGMIKRLSGFDPHLTMVADALAW
jgi:hypothetical protein